MKFSSRPQFHRLREMLDLIRRGTCSGDYPNCTRFARVFGVTRQTALRDLDFLRDEWKAPVAYDASRKGYFLSDQAWTLPPLKLERREVFALGVAQKLMASFRGTPVEEEMRSALAKVAESLEGHVSMDPALLSGRVSVVGEDYAPQNPDVWEAAMRCIERRERVVMRYRKFNGETGDYEVDPLHLAAYHGDWYLLAFHHRRGTAATFAISRIASLRGLGVHFPPPDEQALRERLARGFGIAHGEEPMDVRLKFAPSVAAYIAGRVWHPSQEIRWRRRGAVELRMWTSGWKELVRFVLSWTPDVEVLAPKRLRDRVREKLAGSNTHRPSECS